MKKLMTLMLGMMFVLGTTTVFAQEKGETKSTEKTKKKGGKKKSTEKKTEEKK
jgi:hypothetical protein